MNRWNDAPGDGRGDGWGIGAGDRREADTGFVGGSWTGYGQPVPTPPGYAAAYTTGGRSPQGLTIALAVLSAVLLAAVVAGAILFLARGRGDAPSAQAPVAATTSTRAGSATAAPPATAPSASTVTVTATTVTAAPEPSSRPEPRSGGATRPAGDLGLSTPMTRPACDGRGIVVLYSAVTPGAYASEIRTALANNPGARYLRTDQACPSLRQRDENGNIIYAVYRESGYSRSELCADVAAAPSGAYGRWLDTTSDPDVLVTC